MSNLRKELAENLVKADVKTDVDALVYADEIANKVSNYFKVEEGYNKLLDVLNVKGIKQQQRQIKGQMDRMMDLEEMEGEQILKNMFVESEKVITKI